MHVRDQEELGASLDDYVNEGFPEDPIVSQEVRACCYGMENGNTVKTLGRLGARIHDGYVSTSAKHVHSYCASCCRLRL
jgi:hypothetical protein